MNPVRGRLPAGTSAGGQAGGHDTMITQIMNSKQITKVNQLETRIEVFASYL